MSTKKIIFTHDELLKIDAVDRSFKYKLTYMLKKDTVFTQLRTFPQNTIMVKKGEIVEIELISTLGSFAIAYILNSIKFKVHLDPEKLQVYYSLNIGTPGKTK